MLHGVEDSLELCMSTSKIPVRTCTIQIDKMVKFRTDDGNEQKFKMSTSIGSPVKVLKVNKNDWYAFI